METYQLAPMTTGEILDRSFRLYRSHFIRFIAIVAIVYVPIALLSTVLQHVVLTASRGGEDMVGLRVVGSLVLAFGTILAMSLCNAALLKSISESYLGGDVSVGQAYRFVLPKLGTLIWAAILVYVVVVLGLFLLVVPGIIFSLWYALTTQAIVLENLKARRGMKRSKALVSGNLGKVFLVYLVVLLITVILGSLLSYGSQYLAGVVAGDNVTLRLLIVRVGGLIGEVLGAPIGAGAMILLYYDLRIRKEGFDLEMLARSLAIEGPAADAASPNP